MVGVSSFEGIVGDHPRRPGSHWRFEPRPGEDRLPLCHEAYYRATSAMQRSAQLRRLADEFIRQRLAGGPFMALHVRCGVCGYFWGDAATPPAPARVPL